MCKGQVFAVVAKMAGWMSVFHTEVPVLRSWLSSQCVPCRAAMMLKVLGPCFPHGRLGFWPLGFSLHNSINLN